MCLTAIFDRSDYNTALADFTARLENYEKVLWFLEHLFNK
jgi:hypothetical protein